MDKKTLKLANCGLFAALVIIATLISVPIGGGAYLNAGDAVIHVCAYFIGGLPAVAVAAIGSAAADIILGSMIFAPATFVIKGAMAFCSFLLLSKFKSKSEHKLVNQLSAVIISGLVMPVGYLIYELLLSQLGLWENAVAFTDALFNLIQYAFGCIVGVLLIRLTDKITKKQ